MKHKILLLLALFTSTSLFASVKPFYGFDSYKTKARGGQNVMIPSNIMSGLNPVYNAPMKIGSKNLASLSCVGSPKVPIVLVQFSNVSFSASGDADIVDYYDKYWNGTGDGQLYKGAGSYGSVSDYFYAQSGGLFTPQFVVIGPVTLSRAYSYYGQNQGTEKDININQFYEEAIGKILELNVDLTQFDNNNDGVIDMLYFVYAGLGENEIAADDPYTIWPKEQPIKSTIHDMDFGSFASCNELTGNKGSGIGVMCHELSHALGLPDFYTIDYIGFGLDYWDLMDSGSYCKNGYQPCGYSAYELSFMGWRDLITLTAGQGCTVTIYPMTDERGRGYKIVNPANPNEYYIIENRKSESWDKYIGYGTPGWGYHSGLLITHVDYDATAWNKNRVNVEENHPRMTIIPADGEMIPVLSVDDVQYTLNEYLTSMNGDMYPGSLNITSFKDDQQIVYYGEGMGQPITNIVQNVDGSITFDFCGGETNSIETNPILKTNQPKMVYDMNGRVVNIDRNQFNRGIYIINGKKVLVK